MAVWAAGVIAGPALNLESSGEAATPSGGIEDGGTHTVEVIVVVKVESSPPPDGTSAPDGCTIVVNVVVTCTVLLPLTGGGDEGRCEEVTLVGLDCEDGKADGTADGAVDDATDGAVDGAADDCREVFTVEVICPVLVPLTTEEGSGIAGKLLAGGAEALGWDDPGHDKSIRAL